MSHLLREHAPITAAGWDRIDQEARERLTPALAARKLIDFAGPHGWQHSATNLGRTQRVTKPPAEGLTAVQRQVLVPRRAVRFPAARSAAVTICTVVSDRRDRSNRCRQEWLSTSVELSSRPVAQTRNLSGALTFSL